MPEINKKQLNEQFTTLLIEILDTQRQIIEKLNELKNQNGNVTSDIWKAL